MASYSVNQAAVAQAQRLIDSGQYVLNKQIELAAHDLLQRLDAHARARAGVGVGVG